MAPAWRMACVPIPLTSQECRQCEEHSEEAEPPRLVCLHILLAPSPDSSALRKYFTPCWLVEGIAGFARIKGGAGVIRYL